MSKRLAFEFNAQQRAHTGKTAARRLRLAHQVPAIVYGAGKAPEPITLELKEVMKALSHEAVYSHILTLNVGSNAEKVVLKALTRHHIKNEVTHLDFQRIKAGEKLTMHIPLHFIGENDAPGVKHDGGVISHLIKDVEVKCLPENLPEYIEVDATELKMDESIHLSQIKLPHGVELVLEVNEDHDPTVMSIHHPRVEIEETEVAEKTEETGESAKADSDKETKAEE